MFELGNNWAINALAGLGAFRLILDLIKDKLASWLSAMSDYLTRKFDRDGNPKTLDYCYLYNPGTGKFDPIGIRFDFNWFRPWKPGKVWVHYLDEAGQIINKEPFSFENWGKMRKGFIKGTPPREVASREKVGS